MKGLNVMVYVAAVMAVRRFAGRFRTGKSLARFAQEVGWEMTNFDMAGERLIVMDDERGGGTSRITQLHRHD